jgi:RNA 3'-terminal phosphate cyclase
MILKGCRDFRARLVYATLAQKTIIIKDIRAADTNPGLRGSLHSSSPLLLHSLYVYLWV